MKKIRIIALVLAIVMAFSCMMPVMSFAQDVEQSAEEYTISPYLLRTEGVVGSSNKVKVWLELSPVIAEGIAAYQIALQLENRGGVAVAGRKMELDFDKALDDAQIKETRFNSDEQTMKIYVAGTKNLVQTGADENGNITNILPIGTVTVEALSLKAENPFKIVLCGETGGLKTVGLDCQVRDAASIYGTAEDPFEIPVDGTIFSIPDYSFTLSKTGEGTVEAYKVSENGTQTALAQGEAVVENTKVKLDIKAADGYKIASVTAKDKATGEAVAIDADYSFILSGDIEVKVVFSKTAAVYDISVLTNGKGTVKIYSIEGSKETLVNDSAESGAKIRIDAEPADGYRVARIVVIDRTSGLSTEISEDNSFILSGNTEVVVTFEKIPDPPTVTEDQCECMCHKTGFSGFIYKIVRFFWKLFNTNPVCDCGVAHY